MMNTKPKVLIVDDEESIRKLLKARLEREGFEVTISTHAEEAIQSFENSFDFHLISTDLKMPGKDGFALMEWAKAKDPSVRVIMMTGFGEKDVAVKALRLGACDYLEKPCDLDEYVHAVKRGVREYQLEQENRDLMSRLQERVQRMEKKESGGFWFESKAQVMKPVQEWLQVLERESARGGGEEPSVLIMGESGTGKEGIAYKIHGQSRRAKGPWVAVNCANFSEQLLESELFGHEKGAFTGALAMKRGLFELAKGGTLFLDEIGEMDVKLQARLLRVLQEKVFRRVGGSVELQAEVRVLAATNRNLIEKVQKNEFREDLYHRLNRVMIELPPLRDRAEDVLSMSRELAKRAFEERGKRFHGFASEAEEALSAYPWPGNVRELINVIERAALLSQGHSKITLKELSLPASPAHILAARSKISVVSSEQTGGSALGDLHSKLPSDLSGGFTQVKKEWGRTFECDFLTTLLKRHGGNVSGAAREAKLDRSNFLRLLRKHHLNPDSFRSTKSDDDQAA